MNFDEALLPEASWEPDHIAREYEVEDILDDRKPLQTGTENGSGMTNQYGNQRHFSGLLYDYLRRKKSEHRFQMVQVADEN
ncbi:hypothetical protein PHMEG_00030227 [Phytophthora megakarya]|uniref:Uncharacterized protein n=1 Tax=Phytophthora megakarya TaxID=4795 RepID=A0A225V291_9STRA|nr:hypothetical protein PHMEG_00030227 [Phytophthora megakarya]